MFENFRPKPKQETVPIVSENNTENKESLENQIEQETIKLDANLEVLKAEIDSVGGIEELNKKIKSHDNEVKAGKLMTGVAGIGTLVLTVLLGYAKFDQGYDILPIDFNDAQSIMGSTTQLIGAAVGGFASIHGIKYLAKNWWENRKLKSLKNKAEAAGIA
jgi:hypothetical protein